MRWTYAVLNSLLLTSQVGWASPQLHVHQTANLLVAARPKVESEGWRNIEAKEFEKRRNDFEAKHTEWAKTLSADPKARQNVESDLDPAKKAAGRVESFDVECIERQFEYSQPETVPRRTTRFEEKAPRFRAFRATIVMEIDPDPAASSSTIGRISLRTSSGRFPENILLMYLGRNSLVESQSQVGIGSRFGGSHVTARNGRRISADSDSFSATSMGQGGDLGFQFTLSENVRERQFPVEPEVRLPEWLQYGSRSTNYQITCQ